MSLVGPMVSAVTQCVCDVLLARPPGQVFQPIVGGVAVAVERFMPRGARADKSLKHKLVHISRLRETKTTQRDQQVPAFMRAQFPDPALDFGAGHDASPHARHHALQTSHPAPVADRVQPFPPGDFFPLLFHEPQCSTLTLDPEIHLSTSHNHNLVHTCMDMILMIVCGRAAIFHQFPRPAVPRPRDALLPDHIFQPERVGVRQ